MPIPLVFLLFLVAIAALLVKFATTDGDFTLISKGHAKREEIEGRVVWITGASRGIGEILAGQFLNLGAKVILSARNVSELERVKTELITKHPSGGVEVLPLDLASGEESLKEAVQKAECLFSGSGVDYMVHNAAFERPKTNVLKETEEGIQATFNVNVLGTINLTRLLAPYMLKRGRGHFVVMSSAAGKCPAPGQAMYSASKHALNGYFHTLRSELCQEGIKVTIVCPGPIDTNKNDGSSASGQSGSSEKRVPSKRCAELTIVAASHGLKEVWISYQPVLLVMYMVQYMPTVGYWLVDKNFWHQLEVTLEDTTQVKESNLAMLCNQYEIFRMKKNELIGDMFTHFTDIINTSKVLGKTYPQSEMICKILSLPFQWNSKVTAIQQMNSDLNSMKLETLMDNLTIYKMELKMRKETEEGESSKDKDKSIVLKVRFEEDPSRKQLVNILNKF